MRGTRVTTPDGYVWLVRRRWASRDTALRRYLDRRRAWRRMLWTTRGKRLDLDLVGPTPESWMVDIELAQYVVVLLCGIVIAAAAAGLGFLGWLLVTLVVPSMPHPAAIVGGLGGVILVAAASLLIHRPWLVEAEHQGIDQPRRVWRVHGWRRGRRCAREVAAAIRQGRLDVEPEGAVPENPRSPLAREIG